MAKTSTRVTINVTEDDIERAHKNDSYNCVVAQAVARVVKDATHIDVDTQSIRFTVDDERRIYMTPYAVQGYVIAFDAGDDLQPFSFQLRDPKRIARKVMTQAGKAAQNARSRARKSATDASIITSKKTQDSPSTEVMIDPREAAKAAYTEAREAHANAPASASDKGGRKAPPRVFKKKRRTYGHRTLRINQDA